MNLLLDELLQAECLGCHVTWPGKCICDLKGIGVLQLPKLPKFIGIPDEVLTNIEKMQIVREEEINFEPDKAVISFSLALIFTSFIVVMASQVWDLLNSTINGFLYDLMYIENSLSIHQ